MSNSQQLKHFIKQHFEHVVSLWQQDLLSSWASNHNSLQQINLERHCASLLTGFLDSLGEQQTAKAEDDLITLLTEVGGIWAKKGFSASETSNFIIMLKQLLTGLLIKDDSLDKEQRFSMLVDVQSRLDSVLLVCHESYTSSREKLIKQQSSALLELSSPVVKMWEKTLLLPLIGVIDTGRAKQITEALLSEITKQEATVTVLDLTGVPLFDTAVAGHLIKTVNAARMLGCKIIMTGISPEGALVLTKLGIEFKDVETRGNLHSGVKTAFSYQGLSIVTDGAQ